MNFEQAMRVAASGMSAQRLRLNLLSANLANADTTRTESGGPYRRKDPVFRAESFADVFEEAINDSERENVRGVQVERVLDSDRFREVYDPQHPDADAEGYVTMPDVNVIEEMTDLLQSTRTYEANVQAVKALKAMAREALNITGGG
ncbi:MAG: flagellar basal body rod protein FlgC [Myxococcales bacterium]|nr:MAG: flagellar basal body rod protein FlgC [Myxococcales bacterium]